MVEKLVDDILKLKNELHSLYLKNNKGDLKQSHLITKTKKEIARKMTIINSTNKGEK